jgi:hypothetical protein
VTAGVNERRTVTRAHPDAVEAGQEIRCGADEGAARRGGVDTRSEEAVRVADVFLALAATGASGAASCRCRQSRVPVT